MKDSGAHGPCQNPTAPHLQSINASHSRSVPSPTLPLTPSLTSPPPAPFLISKVMHPLFSLHPSFLADGFIHELITSLLSPSLFLLTHIQWKKPSHLLCLQWELAEPQDISDAKRRSAHQVSHHSPGLPVTSAKHTHTSLVGPGLTASQLVLAQLSAYCLQIESVRGKWCTRLPCLSLRYHRRTRYQGGFKFSFPSI